MSLNQKESQLFKDIVASIFEKNSKLPKSNTEIYFDIKSSSKVIAKAIKLFKHESDVLQIKKRQEKADFVIVGDIHGNLDSLINIFNENGDISTTQYLFLGDYVDRGKNSCEVIILLFALKCLYPQNIYLIRGNHEFEEMTKEYGFEEECLTRIKPEKEGINFYKKILNSFKFLPVCSILNDKIFCVHGGISASIKDRSYFSFVHKIGSKLTPIDQIQIEFFWSDPSDLTDDYADNPNRQRMDFQIFGKNALKKFLAHNKFDLVIRAHQFFKEGYNWPFGENGGLLTVFSSSNYCGLSNDATVALVSNDNTVKVVKINK